MTRDLTARGGEPPAAAPDPREIASIALKLRIFPIRRVGSAWIAASFALMLIFSLWSTINETLPLIAYLIDEPAVTMLMTPRIAEVWEGLLGIALVTIGWIFYTVVICRTYYAACRALQPLTYIKAIGGRKPVPPVLATVLMMVPVVNLFWLLPGYLRFPAYGRKAARITGEPYIGPSRGDVLWFAVPMLLVILANILYGVMMEGPVHGAAGRFPAELYYDAIIAFALTFLFAVQLRLLLRLDAMIESCRRGWERYAARSGEPVMTRDLTARGGEPPATVPDAREVASIALKLRIFPIRQVGSVRIVTSCVFMLIFLLWPAIEMFRLHEMLADDRLAAKLYPGRVMETMALQGVLMLVSVGYGLIMFLTYYRAWKAVSPLTRLETARADNAPSPAWAVVLMLVPIVNLFQMFPGYLKLAVLGRRTARMTGEPYAGPGRLNIWCYLVGVMLLLLAAVVLLHLSVMPWSRLWTARNMLLLMACFGPACAVLLVIQLRLALRLDAMTGSCVRGWERLKRQTGKQAHDD